MKEKEGISGRPIMETTEGWSGLQAGMTHIKMGTVSPALWLGLSSASIACGDFIQLDVILVHGLS